MTAVASAELAHGAALEERRTVVHPPRPRARRTRAVIGIVALLCAGYVGVAAAHAHADDLIVESSSGGITVQLWSDPRTHAVQASAYGPGLHRGSAVQVVAGTEVLASAAVGADGKATETALVPRPARPFHAAVVAGQPLNAEHPFGPRPATSAHHPLSATSSP